MLSNIETLKKKASEQFSNGLAQAVANRIDENAQKKPKKTPSALSCGSMVPYSLATFFFSDKFYSELKVGNFSGRPLVSWDGMDNFVYIPDKDKPFAYTTSDNREIKPRVMYTDGGSIPRILRGLTKFSSWSYAPAFIVHDWLFTAKKCRFEPDTGWAFLQTALVMAEAMKTLMEVGYINYEGKLVKLEKAEDTLYLMYLAVSSFIAKNVWEDDSSLSCISS